MKVTCFKLRVFTLLEQLPQIRLPGIKTLGNETDLATDRTPSKKPAKIRGWTLSDFQQSLIRTARHRNNYIGYVGLRDKLDEISKQLADWISVYRQSRMSVEWRNDAILPKLMKLRRFRRETLLWPVKCLGYFTPCTSFTFMDFLGIRCLSW